MSLRLVLTRAANRDIVRFAQWDVKTGGKSVERIDGALLRLARGPFPARARRAQRDGIDLLYLPVPPHHGVFYLVDQKSEELVVYRIVDARQAESAT